MSRTVKVITVAYAIALMFTYVTRHPPGWLASVAVTASGSRSIHLFGHRIDVSLDVTRSHPLLLPSPLLRAWLKTPVTSSCLPLQPSKTGPFPEDITYPGDVDDSGGSTEVDGR